MPLKYYICPDAQQVEVETCLSKRGCRLFNRCMPLPILRRASWDRKYQGVSPSQAGNGARYIWLRATCDYAIVPFSRLFAILGVDAHERASEKTVTDDVFSEEKVSDRGTTGILDLLEEDEYSDIEQYNLTDYKTSGSFMVAKWTGKRVKKVDRPVLDEKTGKQAVYKSGKRKGQKKWKQERQIVHDVEWMLENQRGVTLQLNRYKIAVEKKGFKVGRLRVFAIPRDGGLWIAHQRGVTERGEWVDLQILPEKEVLDYYDQLQSDVDAAFANDYAPVCRPWETWGGQRCAGYCDVREFCKDLCLEYKETWPGTGKEKDGD